MFRLCVQLGWPHPDHLSEVLSTRQVHEWAEFYGQEPWGYEAEDMRSALHAYVVAKSAGAKQAKIEDFRMMPPAPAVEDAEGEYVLANQVRRAFGLPIPKR